MITLKTLHEATAQEVYDQVCNHLLTQNCKSEGDEKCLYRGPNGTKCAAGCLIGDDEYKPELDESKSSNWGALVDEGLVPIFHCQLISRLQQVHDHFSINIWKRELIKVAGEFDLKPVGADEVRS